MDEIVRTVAEAFVYTDVAVTLLWFVVWRPTLRATS